MKGIVIYEGKYGSTEQYSKWIGEDLEIDVVPVKKIKFNDIVKYDFIILGSSIIAYKLSMKNWINKNWEKISSKKIFLFTVSGAPPENKEKMKEFLDNSISSEIQNKMKIFHFPGRMIFRKLPIFMRIMLNIVGGMQKDPVVRKKFTEDYDFMKKDYTKFLIETIQNLTII